MNELYYFPGACSVAVHIALLETGLPYHLVHVNVFEGEQYGPEYRKIHPLSRIPALRLSDGTVLTEVGAILQHIDAQSPSPTLPLHGPAHIQVLQWMSVFASSVHPPFAQVINPRRVTDDESLFEQIKKDGLRRGLDLLRYVDERLSERGTVLDAPSLLDGYALVFFLWGMRMKLPVADLPRYVRLARMQARRPAVVRALTEEGLDSVPEKLGALADPAA